MRKPNARRSLATVAIVAVAVAASPSVLAAQPAAPSASASATPVETYGAAELDTAIARLSSPSPVVRAAAAQVIAMTPADALPLLEARLLKAPEASAGALWLVIDRARKSSSDDVDLLAAVIAESPTSATRTITLYFAGIRACEKIANVAAARVLVHLAVANKGLLKSTVTQSLKKLGDSAVAALIEVRNDNDKDLRGWANKTLDAMGKFLPSDAVQVHDPQALADVLIALGKLKDPDAIRVIVAYLDADRVQVREAARRAIAQFGDEAKPVLKETYDAFTSLHAGDDWGADRILRELLAAYDKVRLAEVFKLLDDGNAARDAGKLEDAIADYDALLARAPTFDRKAELAPAYVELAHGKQGNDPVASRALLAKALRLCNGTPLAASIQSELDTLDAVELESHGVVDVALLQEAIALDPSNNLARDLLQKAKNDDDAREGRLRRIGLTIGAGLLAMILAILFVGRKRSSSPPPAPPRRPIRV